MRKVRICLPALLCVQIKYIYYFIFYSVTLPQYIQLSTTKVIDNPAMLHFFPPTDIWNQHLVMSHWAPICLPDYWQQPQPDKQSILSNLWEVWHSLSKTWIFLFFVVSCKQWATFQSLGPLFSNICQLSMRSCRSHKENCDSWISNSNTKCHRFLFTSARRRRVRCMRLHISEFTTNKSNLLTIKQLFSLTYEASSRCTLHGHFF